MDDLHKRILLFLIGCMGTRFGLTALATNPANLQYMWMFTLPVALGFLYIYMTGARKTGAETMGTPIWWNDLRPVHGLLYLLFSAMAFKGSGEAWKVLLFDTVLGLTAFLMHHYS